MRAPLVTSVVLSGWSNFVTIWRLCSNYNWVMSRRGRQPIGLRTMVDLSKKPKSLTLYRPATTSNASPLARTIHVYGRVQRSGSSKCFDPMGSAHAPKFNANPSWALLNLVHPDCPVSRSRCSCITFPPIPNSLSQVVPERLTLYIYKT